MDAAALPPPLLEVRQLCHHYPAPRPGLLARPHPHPVLRNVSLTLPAGRCLGLVGASGSGKSTLARLVLALDTPSSGQVLLDGQDLHRLPPAALRQMRQNMAMVFQDPATALNPRRSVGWSVAEPLTALGGPPLAPAEVTRRVAQALEDVGLHAQDAQRYPGSFSGGQRQRIALAHAIIARPRLLVLDEPVSALDVCVQAQVLNLLLELQQRLGLGYLLISHDLSVISHLCDQVLVLHQGEVVESGTPQQLLHAARSPVTQALLHSVPTMTPGAARLRYAMNKKAIPADE